MVDLTKNDRELIKHATALHSYEFNQIREKIADQTKIGSFIAAVLGDFIYSMDDAVLDDMNNQITDYFDNDVKAYLMQLIGDINDARNSVINIFLMFIDDKEKLNKVASSNMGDCSLDYLYSIGEGSVTSKPYAKAIKGLSEIEKTTLNYYLARADFEELD